MLRILACLCAACLPLAVAGCPAPDEQIMIGGDGDTDVDADGDADSDDGPECVPEVYPCGPYGSRNCDTIDDLSFVAANAPARSLAGGDGLLSLGDLYADDDIVGVLLYGTAGWCSVCGVESAALNDIYADFQNIDGSGKRVEFVAVVFQDTVGEPADVDYAESYANRYDFVFPTVADYSGDVLRYFQAAASPGNIFVDATTMRIVVVETGFVEGSLRTILSRLNGDVECREE